jgi:hypothetical protein
MRHDASGQAIKDAVAQMQLNRIDSFLARTTLSALRKRAYSRPVLERMVQATPFGRCDIREEPLGFEVTLTK